MHSSQGHATQRQWLSRAGPGGLRLEVRSGSTARRFMAGTEWGAGTERVGGERRRGFERGNELERSTTDERRGSVEAAGLERVRGAAAGPGERRDGRRRRGGGGCGPLGRRATVRGGRPI